MTEHARAQMIEEPPLTGCVLPAEISPQLAAPAQAACSQPAQLLGTSQAQKTAPDGFQQLAGAAMQAVRAAEWAVERAVRTSPSRWGWSSCGVPLLATANRVSVDAAAKKASSGSGPPVLGGRAKDAGDQE